MRNIKLPLSLLLLHLLLGLWSPVWGAEEAYTVYKSEVMSMRNELNNIKSEKRLLLIDLQNSKISLQEAEQRRMDIEKKLFDLAGQLNSYQIRLAEREAELTELLNIRKELQNQLTELSISFQEYKTAAETEIKNLAFRKKWQSVLWFIVGWLGGRTWIN